jgi:DNA-binding transcriptional MerR regulator
VQPLTITELERESGVGRNTIYYYIGDGLLPPAQKASATRSIYNQAHVELLREITRLKGEGLSLRDIREELAERIETAAENDVDLVARQNKATIEAILQAAARRFAAHGYEIWGSTPSSCTLTFPARNTCSWPASRSTSSG